MAHCTLGTDQGHESQGITISKPPTLGANDSLPNSQQSSLNDSSSSLLSQMRPSGVSELSQGSGVPREMTPSTSLSNKSSQERMGLGGSDDRIALTVDDRLGSQEELYTINTPVAMPAEQRFDHTSAPKRMANGEIKSPGHSSPTSPGDSSQYGHSRNSSRTSRGSQVGELSSQLRTRLSYAMVKVQHGWQSHSISELEYMTSNQTSPTSAGPDHGRHHAFPVANSPPAIYPGFLQSSAPTMRMPDYGNASPKKNMITPPNGDFQGDPDYAPPRPQVGASYESFWREHEGVNMPRAHQTGRSSIEGPSLAPPVDILPRISRTESKKIHPPPLDTNNLYNAQGWLNSGSSDLPATPPPKKASKTRTPSQQAAVEKDAVETLLFMSSPGNSGYHPPAALPGTPLRNGFASTSSQLRQPGIVARYGTGTVIGQPHGPFSASKQQSQSRRTLSDADIDKLLDEMPDTSSSDDEDSNDRRPPKGPLLL